MRNSGINMTETVRDECLLEVLHAHHLVPDDAIAVLSVGSLASGWLNERSDYDFYVVAPSAWRGRITSCITVPLRPRAVPVAMTGIAGRRWEVKYWVDSQVDQMLSKAAWRKFETNSSPTRMLAEQEELFLERLATCRPLSGQEWTERRRNALTASAFRAIVTTRSLCEADDCVEDALGQLAAGDTDSAVLSARKALGHVVDALLESRGQYGSRTVKWRARRVRAAAPEELPFEDYWALETMAGLDLQAPSAWVIEIIKRCKALTLEVAI
jgi:hypothetical protein